jgi:hypothetical protein
MNPDTAPTPRWVIKKGDFDGKPYLWDDRKYDNYDLGSLCRILNEYEEKTNEVARLRPLPKQDRTPPRLEAEIEVVDDPSIYSHVEARYATADAIRYLRDEIDYLKKNQSLTQ